MKFLITTSFPSFSATANLPTHIRFCDASFDLSIPLTSPETVDVWICSGEEVTGELMDRWLGQACHIPKSMLVRVIPRLQEYAKGRAVKLAGFPEQKHTTTGWEESILRDAEMLYARTRAHTGIQRLNVPGTMTARRLFCLLERAS